MSNAVFSSDLLFGEAVRFTYDSILDWVRGLDYSKDKIEETIKTIIRALHLDSQRLYYDNKKVDALCEIWASLETSTPCVFEIRKSLCSSFPDEILMYKKLFKYPHRPISYEEYELLPFDKAVELVDTNHVEYAIGNVEDLLDAFEEQKDYQEFENKVQSILDKVSGKFNNSDMAILLLRYMKKIQKLISRYEEIVMQNIDKEKIAEDAVFVEYQGLINLLSESSLSDNTIANISQLNWFTGYADGVIRQLFENKFIVDAVIMSMYQNKNVPYDDASIANGIKEDQEWFTKLNVFEKVRLHITRYVNNIMLYEFMFGKEYPVMSSEEFENIKFKTSISDILRLIRAEKIDEAFAIALVDFWNDR